jgi:hypothetical protein
VVPPKPVKGTVTGIFTGWGSGRYSGKPALSVQFVPKGRSTKAAMTVPNSSSKSSKPTPVSYVSKLSKSLKIGDGVKIGYSALSGRSWMTSMSRIARPKSASDSINVFTFVGSKKVRTSSGAGTVVLARKKSRIWTFLLPPESARTAEPVSQSIAGGDATPQNPGTLSEQVARFVSGDPIVLDYNTVNYKFVLKSIDWHRTTESATLMRVGERTVKGVIYNVAYIKTAKKQSLSLMVPTTTSAGSGTTAAAMTETLKSLKEGQQITVKHIQKKRVLWLDGLSPSKPKRQDANDDYFFKPGSLPGLIFIVTDLLATEKRQS